MYKQLRTRLLATFLVLCFLLQTPVILASPVNAQEVTSSITLSYLKDGSWKSFNQSVESSMDGIKIQTNSNSSYYLQYRTWNQGQSGYYPYVKSNENDYAGSSGKPIQRIQIQAYSNDGTKLVSGVVVMYRALVDGVWLDWVSNADPEWMQSVKNKYNLDGNLDTSASFAGVSTGATISGIEIRVFEEGSISGGGSSGDFSGKEVSHSLSYLSNGTWNSFDKIVTASTIDGIKIQTNSNSSYYLQYRTWNKGQSGYYPYVKSNENDYAGSSGKPIQRIQIQAYKNDGTKLVSGVVVMYRALVDGVWLDWVSNADPEWMQSVKNKYNLDGNLDTSASFAGRSNGATISGIEIRVFEENSISGGGGNTPTGDYKIIEAPHIYQMVNYPTGCESVTAVMALNYAGIDISVDSFIDNYLDKSSGVPFDPNTTFGGNPRSTSGYGCYAPVIKKALDKILPGTGYQAKQLSNVSLEQLCSQYIDNDIPVIMWATMNMAPPRNGNSWTYNGKRIQWIAPEHCLLLVGYDDNHYIFSDSMKTQELTYYSKSSVEAAYKGLFSQAIVLLEGGSTPSDVPVTSVTVLPSKVTMSVGEEYQLTASVFPSNATNKKVTWSSSNFSVASVSSDGRITAKKEGSATLTVKTDDGNKTATCNVTVQSTDPFDPTNVSSLRISYIADVDGNWTLMTLKSQLDNSAYFFAYDEKGTERSVIVSDRLINELWKKEKEYNEHFLRNTVTDTLEFFHLAKQYSDDQVRAGTITDKSDEYYGMWACNASSMLNYYYSWMGIIDKATEYYVLFNSLAMVYCTSFYSSAARTYSQLEYQSIISSNSAFSSIDDATALNQGLLI